MSLSTDMGMSLQGASVLRRGGVVATLEQRGQRWWWFCKDAQGDERTPGMAVQAVAIFLRREAGLAP